jgi:LacI family transcriptional regulator
MSIIDINRLRKNCPKPRITTMKNTKRVAVAVKRRSVLFLPCYRDERMMQGVCQLGYEAGWILDLGYYHTGALPREWDGDGLLCMLQVPQYGRELSDFVLRHKHIPAVDLSLNDPSVALPRVLQDNVAIGRMGAEHLISRGCRHLAFFITDNSSFHRERLHGFREAAATLGCKVQVIHPPADHMQSRIQTDWLNRYFPVNERPLGVMVEADYAAQWLAFACNSAGLSIPDDVAILGVDNSPEICELSPVPISSIDNNTFRHGYEGAKLLNDLMSGRPAPSEPLIVPAGALHVRASTDIMATRHPHVATALKYIDHNYSSCDLTPEKVAAQVPMSARRLSDAFLKYVGRSIYQEITHRRIQHALRLLRSTQDKLWEIAESAGFNSPEVMSRIIRRELGNTPSSYRNPSTITPATKK